jgi:hypothetical protein
MAALIFLHKVGAVFPASKEGRASWVPTLFKEQLVALRTALVVYNLNNGGIWDQNQTAELVHFNEDMPDMNIYMSWLSVKAIGHGPSSKCITEGYE